MNEAPSAADRVRSYVDRCCPRVHYRDGDHGYTCFVGAPDPTVGNSFLLAEEQVQRTRLYFDASVRAQVRDGIEFPDEEAVVDHVRTNWDRLSALYDPAPKRASGLEAFRHERTAEFSHHLLDREEPPSPAFSVDSEVKTRAKSRMKILEAAQKGDDESASAMWPWRDMFAKRLTLPNTDWPDVLTELAVRQAYEQVREGLDDDHH